MATISTLAVNLIARTSAFERGMQRGRKSVKSFKTTVAGSIKTLARFGSGLLAIAGVGGMGLMLKRTLTVIDATAKLSDRLGIATEALVGLRFAANIYGVTSEALDKSLDIFVRRMGEVKSGSGEAKRGLEALGLTAEKMIKLTPEKALGVIADRIRELGTQAEKSAAAYFLFGRSGAQLVNLFEQGSEAIAAFQNEAESLNLTFSRLDAEKIEKANDALTRMRGAVKGLTRDITIKLAPAIELLAVAGQGIFGDEGRPAFPTGITALSIRDFPEATELQLKEEIARIEKNILATSKRESAFAKNNVALFDRLESVRSRRLKAANDALDTLQKQKKEQDAIAKVEKQRIKNAEVFALKIKAAGIEIKKQIQANLDLQELTKDEADKLPSGRFQQIRSEFIDVAALNPAATPTTELQLLNKKTDVSNELLRELNRNAIGVFQA